MPHRFERFQDDEVEESPAVDEWPSQDGLEAGTTEASSSSAPGAPREADNCRAASGRIELPAAPTGRSTVEGPADDPESGDGSADGFDACCVLAEPDMSSMLSSAPPTRVGGDAALENGPWKLRYAPFDLYIVYSIKLVECIAYYGYAYIYVEYLSDEFGFSDREAGIIYSGYGFFCTVIGLTMGCVIDKLGVRQSMLIGCTSSCIARFLSLVTFSKSAAWFTAVTFFPVGAAFGVPVLALGVRRYTHEENRGFAFSFFYAVLCLACLLGSFLINRVRAEYPNGTTVMGYPVSWMRVVVFWCTLLTMYTVVAAYFVRDIQVLSERPIKEKAICQYKPRNDTVMDATREVVSQPRFWRLAAITFLFCGVRMTFRHLDATFPKYFVRTFGPQAPFELILAINPIVTMCATPMVTALLLSYDVRFDRTLLIGAFISGISVFMLSVWESFSGAVCFVLLLSVGEATWSPKLYEFSTMAAPEGREGVYVAITMAPMYLASVPVGALSGWALEHYCPKGSAAEERHTRFMWFVLGCIGFSSPVLLMLFRKCLLRPGDDNPMPKNEGVGTQHPRGLERLPRKVSECDFEADARSPTILGASTPLEVEGVAEANGGSSPRLSGERPHL